MRIVAKDAWVRFVERGGGRLGVGDGIGRSDVGCRRWEGRGRRGQEIFGGEGGGVDRIEWVRVGDHLDVMGMIVTEIQGSDCRGRRWRRHRRVCVGVRIAQNRCVGFWRDGILKDE